MKTIKKIFGEILRGENIITYCTILAVFVLLVLKILSFFDDVDVPILNKIDVLSIILGVLTLILIFKIQKKWILDEQTNVLNKIDNHINSPNFDIIDSWSSPKVYGGISKTSLDIVLVQSWFPDIPNISEGLIKASKKSKINVDFFLIDPTSPFGVQRWKEVNKKLDVEHEEATEKYEAQYSTSVENIKNRLDNIENISYNIYTYSSLPTLKFYIIDRTEFYFGWLGLDGNSTQNVCLHISKKNNSLEIEKAGNKIMEHLNVLRKNSKLIS